MSTEKFVVTIPIDDHRCLIRDHTGGKWLLSDNRKPRAGIAQLSATDCEMINAALRAGIAYGRSPK